MPLFGGDPRLLQIELILQINKWYDILCIPIMIANQINNLSDMNSTILGMVQMLFEVFRIWLVNSHQKSDIPNFVGYLILSLIPPFIMEIIWLMFIRGTSPLIKVILFGFAFQQVLTIFVGIIAYLRLSIYLNKFYEFAKVNKNSKKYEPIVDADMQQN